MFNPLKSVKDYFNYIDKKDDFAQELREQVSKDDHPNMFEYSDGGHSWNIHQIISAIENGTPAGFKFYTLLAQVAPKDSPSAKNQQPATKVKQKMNLT